MVEQQIKEFETLAELLEACKAQGATPGEVTELMWRFIENKAREKAVPLRATLELTPFCNLDCKMCYVHLNQEQFQQQGCGLLTGAQWASIIQQAVEMGLMEVTLTGGEALLHPDFDDIFVFLEKNNVRVNLKSNGLLLTDERLAFLLEHHISSIQISLYGSDDDSYERVTGERVFSQVMAAIERVRQVGIDLEIVITPSKYMWKNVKQLIRHVDALGIAYSINPGLADPLEETGRSGQEHDLSLEQYIDLYKFLIAIKGKVLEPSCLEEVSPTGGNRSDCMVGIRCAAGRSTFTVTWRGMVHPCRMLENIGFNGLNVALANGWKSMNAAVKAYPVPRECFECDYEGVCTPCVVQHSYGAEKGHASPMLCKRAQRMAEEGFYTRKSK